MVKRCFVCGAIWNLHYRHGKNSKPVKIYKIKHHKTCTAKKK